MSESAIAELAPTHQPGRRVLCPGRPGPRITAVTAGARRPLSPAERQVLLETNT